MAKQGHIVVEVCERGMDYFLDRNNKRQPKIHAQVKDKPGVWACGESVDDAVGNLVRFHPEEFGVEIKYLRNVSR